MKHDTKVLFFTGAGISAESGVPTFQSMPGIRDRLTRSFANEHPEEYRETIKMMKDACDKAEPNAAHKAIAEAGFPVITMNIDGLHAKAGSKNVVTVHGTLPTDEELKDPNFALNFDGVVLYGDIAPEYETAMKLVRSLSYDSSVFVIVGTSFYTDISVTLRNLAKKRRAKVIVINEDATTRVPELCERLKSFMNGGNSNE